MCYEERYFSEWATKRKRQRAEPTAQGGERPKPGTQPERPKPESQKPRLPERELEPV
jgi:hypothetical protein